MPDFLECTVDKFLFKVARDRFYTSHGAWAMWCQAESGNRVRIGLTDFLQQLNGDVAFAAPRPVGTELEAGEEIATMETIKVTFGLPSPVGGTVVEVNPELDATPELLNQDPYGAGWLAVVEASDWERDRAALLEPQAYFCEMKKKAEEETAKP